MVKKIIPNSQLLIPNKKTRCLVVLLSFFYIFAY